MSTTMEYWDKQRLSGHSKLAEAFIKINKNNIIMVNEI